MALGATLKVKMDSSAVRRGLSGIRSGFTRLGGVVRGIGGAMRRSLFGMTAAAGALAFAFKKVADEGSVLSDMAVQTGVSVKKLVVMQEALRRAGAPIADTSRMLSMFAANMQEAIHKGGMAREALEEMLRISIADIAGKPLDEQFMMVLEKIRDMGDELPMLEMAMENLFGARMGFGVLRLAKDLDANMKAAAKSAESHAEFMDENATELDRVADAYGRLGMIVKTSIGKMLINLPWDKIADFIEGLQDIDTGPFFDGLVDFFSNMFNWEKWKEWATNIGTAIGDGIKGAFPGLGKLLGDVPGIGPAGQPSGGAGSQKPVNDLLNETKDTNRILSSIMLKGGAEFV